jgi:methionyl-tRNA formyltransferase
MRGPAVDLLVGSDIGRWVVEYVDTDEVRLVVTLDAALAMSARARGLDVVVGDLNEVDTPPGDVCLSVHYPRILKPAALERYGVLYNLHPGRLPWGRGFYPVFWALWEGTPAGATLHRMVEKVDGGPIVSQRHVGYSQRDTGGSLLERVREAEKELFMDAWHSITAGGKLPEMEQLGNGSYHSRAEFFELKSGHGWESLAADELVRLVRCLTVPGLTTLEVSLQGGVFDLRLEPLELNVAAEEPG